MFLLFSSGYRVKWVSNPKQHLQERPFHYWSIVVEMIANLAANICLSWVLELQFFEGLELLNWDGLSPGLNGEAHT